MRCGRLPSRSDVNYYSKSYLLQSMSMYNIYIYRYYKSWYACTQSDEAPRTDWKRQPISWWVINDQTRYSMVPPSCKMVFPINYRYIYHKTKWNWSFFYQPCHLGGTTLYHKPTGHLCKIAIPSYIHHISYVQRYPTYIHRYIHTYINRISYIHISILFQLPPRTFCHQKWKAKLLQVLCSGKRPCPETSQQLGKMGCFKGQFEASTVQIFMGYTRDIMEYVIVCIYIYIQYIHIYIYIYNGHLLDI